ncbi:MAG TPA: hypothetical protein VFQ38_09495 [Longimicrobiales bacterium]|nr:hypothetical protein [Longimicrobiales bacterium]
MQRAFVVAIWLAGAVVPRGASAQDDVGRLSNVWGYLTPEYAFSVTRLAGGVGPELGSHVRTYGVRVEAPTRGMLQPWASVAYLRRPVPGTCEQAGGCDRNAVRILAGPNVDLRAATPAAVLRPYVDAGLGGVLTLSDQTVAFSAAVGAGVLARLNDVVAPRVEARAERFGDRTYLMLALGTRLTIDHGRGDGGTTADREIGSTATAAAPMPRHPSP